MQNRYVRVLVLNALQFALLALLFVGLGARDYVDPAGNNLYAFALAAGSGSLAAIAVTLLFYRLVDKKPLRTLGWKLKRRGFRWLRCCSSPAFTWAIASSCRRTGS